ncbi:MAG: ABC transporter ATP-binding protein/permease [Lachnospiraceae bacterium]|jgi:ATP-binding cassette subfamily B protein|nr:ABC transporter ATP-binding protein/permease [Lachnospiraceae bacterium]
MARNKFDIDETLEKDSEFKFAHLKRLLGYAAPYKTDMIKTVAIMLITSVLSLAAPYLLKIAIDESIPNKDIPGVIGLSAILLACLFLSAVFVRQRIYTMSRVGQSIIRDLRLDLFKHMQELPFAYYDSRPHGKILVRVVNYVNSLSDMLTNGLINLVTDMFSLVAIAGIMLILDIKLTLVSMAGLPLLLLVTWIIKNKQRVAWRLQSAKQSNMNAYIHESLSGMKITQGFVREDFNMNILTDVCHSVRESWIKAVAIMFFMWPAAENISVWTSSLLYAYGAYLVANDPLITLGTVVAFGGYVWRFWVPINNIANIYNTIVVNMSYMERIFETIDEPVLIKDAENAAIMPHIKGNVNFDNVTFCYDTGIAVLKNVSFSIKAGETIALVGPTGAGKTTIINLISRFYEAGEGTVSVDGVDVKSVTLKSLRTQMGVMLQDSFVFAGTIMDNIRYGKLDATDEEVIAAAKAVCAHDFIMSCEDGYQTEVNERGSRLSLGERQLISFARALLADPKILILDEATSSIDTKPELLVQEGLNHLLAGRTSFIIAHRLSTIKNATRIMYIDDGIITEEGTHEELLAKEGAYYELYRAQYAFLG